jgi:hypothetical protein
MEQIRRLKNASQVIDALGGTVIFGRRYKRSKQNVSNYRSTGRLPPEIYLLNVADLQAIGLTAPASIWGIREPRQKSAA